MRAVAGGLAAVAGGMAAAADGVAAMADGVAAVAGRVAAVAVGVAAVAGGRGPVADGVAAAALMLPCGCGGVPEAVLEAVPAEKTKGGPLTSFPGGGGNPLEKGTHAATEVRRGWVGAWGSGHPTPAVNEAGDAGKGAGCGSALPGTGEA